MLANGVQETASAPGSATTINLAGPPTGRRGFLSAFASGAAVYYTMDDGTQFECGIGSVTAGSPNTLTRGTVLSNSSGTTSRLNFTGTTRVICTMLAERMGWVLVQAPVAVSAAAQQEFELAAHFRRFRLTFQAIQADATGRSLALRFGTAGVGGAFSTASYAYGGQAIDLGTGGSSVFGDGTAGCCYVSIEITNTGGASWSGEVDIYPGTTARGVMVDGKAAGASSTVLYGLTSFGVWQGGAGVKANALRVYTATGVAAGTAAGSFTGTLILEGLLN
jgi:hypothetical protein